ncbi:permease prefix domain 1-containing protein [Agromyces sp. MMS24-JH15]|uniref:permease prefix domain 1-containing protein n=1 Tax=Agromyces sp. MMS24-JH15 TaxID=3243765 RepID=UPI00374997C1
MTPTDHVPGAAVHRLLDEAFAEIAVTPETLDLKEEIRGNLVARAAELEAAGRPPADAARTAIAELGDLRELVGDDQEPGSGAPATQAALAARNRVRPNPAFVVRVTLLSVVAAACLILLVLGLLGILATSAALALGLAVAAGAALGIVTGDALHQETSTDHPMPAARAAGYGLATGLVIAALGVAAVLVVAGADLLWLLAPGVAALASVAVFGYLGATQTNRHKPWVLGHRSDTEAVDAFSTDPAAAARFGIYTVVLWTVTAAVFVVLGFTVGWGWALLGIVAGFAAWFILLARMLFPPKR